MVEIFTRLDFTSMMCGFRGIPRFSYVFLAQYQKENMYTWIMLPYILGKFDVLLVTSTTSIDFRQKVRIITWGCWILPASIEFLVPQIVASNCVGFLNHSNATSYLYLNCKIFLFGIIVTKSYVRQFYGSFLYNIYLIYYFLL